MNQIKSVKDLIEDSKVNLSLIDELKDIETGKEPFNVWQYGFSSILSAGYGIALAFFVGVLNWLSQTVQASYKESILADGINILSVGLSALCLHIVCGLMAEIMTGLETKWKSYEYENPYFSSDSYDKIKDLNNITDPICKARFDYYLTTKRVYYFVSVFICTGFYLVKMYP